MAAQLGCMALHCIAGRHAASSSIADRCVLRAIKAQQPLHWPQATGDYKPGLQSLQQQCPGTGGPSLHQEPGLGGGPAVEAGP